MRRFATLALGAALAVPLTASPAAACPPPSEEVPSQPCCQRSLITVTLPNGQTISIPDPFWDPRPCL